MKSLETVYLSEAETAVYLGVARVTLRRWRMALTGPKFIRLGSRGIRYAKSDLDRYMASRTVRTVPDLAAGAAQ